MREIPVGRIDHYWPKAHAAGIRLERPLRLGDRIRIRGHGHDFVQQVTSLELAREPVREAFPGENAAVRTIEPAHEDDEVLKIVQDEGWSAASGTY